MRFGLTLAFALLALPAAAQEEPIQDTIRAQIEAFKADDFARAFTYASPTIHQIFMTSDNFGKMVREGYPMVWHPAEVDMMELRTVAGALWQRVRVTDLKGQSFLLDYQMVQGPNGWLINAVQMQKANDVGT
ncbi:DUF4864 domain-containing protein [bacterium]|nr:DUF4864 domain-containing protein [bacterium]